MSIYAKLPLIQNELNVPKNQVNKYGGYTFRNLDDICMAVKPILKKYGCAMFFSDEPATATDSENTVRTYIKTTLTLVDTEDNTQISVTGFAQEPAQRKGMDPAQVSGTSSTYARKYAANALLLMDDMKDPDSDEGKTESKARKKEADLKQAAVAGDPKPFQTEAEGRAKKFHEVTALLKERGITKEFVLDMYYPGQEDKPVFDKLTEKKYMNIIEHIDDIQKKWEEFTA